MIKRSLSGRFIHQPGIMPSTRSTRDRVRSRRLSPATDATQAERAFVILKSEILKGRIPEGVFLNVESLLTQYKLGRTPFREACQRLYLEQLVDWVPRRGMIVRELSLRDVRDLLEARVIVEREIAALAAVRRSDDEIAVLAAIEKVLTRLPSAPEQIDEFVSANVRFHQLLGEMSRNQELATINRRLLDRMTRISYMELRELQGADIPDLHAEIVRAVRDHDPEGARDAVRRDVVYGQSVLFAAGYPIAAASGQSLPPTCTP